MPFEILRHDITKINTDAIVNSTSSFPFIGEGVDFQINQAAGPLLFNERKSFGYLNPNQAIITKAYNLPSKHVIHVSAPIYIDGKHHEHEDLKTTYLNALSLAHQHKLESIAFPLLSSGNYRFPRGEALDIALSAIRLFLDHHDVMIYLLVYDEASYQISLNRFISIKNYLDHNNHHSILKEMIIPSDMDMNYSISRKLEDLEDELDETFVESLFRRIDEKQLNDVDVYKKANIDRKLFSKIKSNLNYQPSKMTAIAFAIALELNLDQTKDLLNKAGYSLSPSTKFDKIIQYFIEESNYDLYEINQVLFAFDQKTIGGID